MLEEKILNDYKEALKDRNSIKVSTLSFLRAQFMNLAIEKKKKNLQDSDCISAIKKLVKQHQDSIEQFTKGSRQDLAAKEEEELKILKTYLPQEISADELKKAIEETVVALVAEGTKDMGKVMKDVMAKVGQSADNKLVSDLVKDRLTKGKA
jgi:uncharacterized protein YqeY